LYLFLAQVAFGEHIRLVGESSEFGSWELKGAPELTWTEGDVWTGENSVNGSVVYLLPSKSSSFELN